MIQECVFNPLSDVEEAVPELSVDVSEMMASHIIPAGPGTELGYTKETDVSEVRHYLRDKIQTAVSAMRLGQSMAAAAAARKEVNPKGE